MRDVLIKYKEISFEIIKSLKSDSLDNLEELFNKRSELIELMKESTASKEYMKEIIEELDLINLDYSIKEVITQCKMEVNSELEKLKREKNANNLYGRQFQNIYFLNKKI